MLSEVIKVLSTANINAYTDSMALETTSTPPPSREKARKPD